MAITTKDLARICGVSRSTINRALSGNGRINPETKKKILEKAKELDYQPDLNARSMANGKSRTLGVVVEDLDNRFYTSILDAILQEAEQDSYIINIGIHQNRTSTEQEVLRTMLGHKVDGIILNPVSKGKMLAERLDKISVPYCVLGFSEISGRPCVGVDEYKLGYEAAGYIISKGYQHIVFVVPSYFDLEGRVSGAHSLRWKGIQKAIGEAGITASIVTDLSYARPCVEIFRRCSKKMAFFCSADFDAKAVGSALLSAGYLYGRDCGLMGVDASQKYDNWGPRITSVDNHTNLMGKYAEQIVMSQISGSEYEKKVVIDFNIMEGETL